MGWLMLAALLALPVLAVEVAPTLNGLQLWVRGGLLLRLLPSSPGLL